MDKKKSITILRVLFACLFTIFALPISAQDVSKIQFCDKKYEYGEGKDSITLFFKVLDKNGEAVKDVTLANLEKYLVFYEEDKMISPDRYKLTAIAASAYPVTSPSPSWLTSAFLKKEKNRFSRLSAN